MSENDQQPVQPPPDGSGERLVFREGMRRCRQTARNWSGADPSERSHLLLLAVGLAYMLALTVAFALSLAAGWEWLLYAMAVPVFVLVAARMAYDACKGVRASAR